MVSPIYGTFYLFYTLRYHCLDKCTGIMRGIRREIPHPFGGYSFRPAVSLYKPARKHTKITRTIRFSPRFHGNMTFVVFFFGFFDICSKKQKN
jgi:hypothetical protein